MQCCGSSAVAVHLGGWPCGLARAFGLLAPTSRPRACCIPAACRAPVVSRQVEDSIAALNSPDAVLRSDCDTVQHLSVRCSAQEVACVDGCGDRAACFAFALGASLSAWLHISLFHSDYMRRICGKLVLFMHRRKKSGTQVAGSQETVKIVEQKEPVFYRSWHIW